MGGEGATMIVPLRDVHSDYYGFGQLSRLADAIDTVEFEEVQLDMSEVTWFDANMSAPLGALLYGTSRNWNTATLVGLRPRVRDILTKNGFLSAYGGGKAPDTWGTTIRYQRFEPKDDRFFAAYAQSHLKGKGIPRMTGALRKKLLESIFEIFNNAVAHSETKLGIFACGQFYPRKHKLDFSVADLGMGIRENLSRRRKIDLDALAAIKWALTGTNTTKTDAIPGGLGLKLLRDFIELNRGRIQIVSDAGYWEFAAGKAHGRALPHPFPGTVVNVEINTADQNSYRLSTEVDPSDIF